MTNPSDLVRDALPGTVPAGGTWAEATPEQKKQLGIVVSAADGREKRKR